MFNSHEDDNQSQTKCQNISFDKVWKCIITKCCILRQCGSGYVKHQPPYWCHV